MFSSIVYMVVLVPVLRLLFLCRDHYDRVATLAGKAGKMHVFRKKAGKAGKSYTFCCVSAGKAGFFLDYHSIFNWDIYC